MYLALIASPGQCFDPLLCFFGRARGDFEDPFRAVMPILEEVAVKPNV